MLFHLKINKPGQFNHELVWGILGLIALAAARFFPYQIIPTLCWFKRAFNLPCPSCGGTRAFSAMAHGRIGEAFFLNPLASLLFILLLLYIPYALVTAIANTRRIRVDFGGTVERCILAGLFCLAIMANWAYLIIDGR